MRIISGLYRGRTLRGPRGMEVRPTGDRLKETLFDILGPGAAGAVFLDGFAGTGSIGLEAISRGANEVVFIESDRDAVRLIHKNLESLGITSQYRIIQQDIFTALRDLGRQGFRPDIAFFDPPYRWEPFQDLLQLVFKAGMIGPEGLAVVEHHAKAGVPEDGNGYRRRRVVSQGDKRLSFYKQADPPS